jgi:hypothetical protein
MFSRDMFSRDSRDMFSRDSRDMFSRDSRDMASRVAMLMESLQVVRSNDYTINAVILMR